MKSERDVPLGTSLYTHTIYYEIYVLFVFNTSVGHQTDNFGKVHL